MLFVVAGTEEEHDRLRAIVSQGPDFDKYEKYKQRNTYNDRVGVRVEPKKSVLGAYAEPNSQLNLMNARDALYEQLAVPDAVEIGRQLGTILTVSLGRKFSRTVFTMLLYLLADEIATENVNRAQSSKSTARPNSQGKLLLFLSITVAMTLFTIVPILYNTQAEQMEAA